MRCENAKRRLALIAYDDLPSKARLRVRNHLAECAGCRTEFEDMQAFLRLLRWAGRRERERAEQRARSEAVKQRTLEMMRREFARQDAEAAARAQEGTPEPDAESGEAASPPA